MPDSSNWRQQSISRRNAIRAGLVGGVSLVAGCTGGGGTTTDGDGGGGAGDGGDGGTGSDGGDGGSGNDARFTELDRQGTPPAERHFNLWNPAQSGTWFPGQVVFDRLAVYSPASNENYGIIANDWSMPEDDVLEVELSDQWSWHNGARGGAPDWVTQMQIEKAIAEFQSDSENPTVFSELEAVDDTFIRIGLNEPLSERFAVQNTIAINADIGRGVFVKHDDDQWSSWHDTLRNGSDSEVSTTVEEITSTAYPNIQDAIGNGPFQMSEVGDSDIIMERYEDHPYADDINFQEYAYWVPSDTGQVVQPYANGVVDATSKGFPVQDDLQSQLPENTQLFRETLSSNKLFTFNLGQGEGVSESIVSNRNVRRAMLHVLDRQAIEPLLQGVNRIFDWPPCRVPGKVMEAGDHSAAQFVKDNFVKYGQNDTERATELLESEGFERDGDTWLTDEGEEFEVSILNAANRPDFQIWIQNLQDFGITVNQENVDSATFDQRRKNGNYDIIPDGSSANGIFAMWAPDLIVNWVMKTLTHAPTTAEIPMPIGDPDGSSGMKEINIPEHITQWLVTDDEQYHQELMWWWNQYVPEMEVMYQPDAGAINTANWDFGDTPSAIVNGVDDALSVSLQLEEGGLRYKP